MKFFTREVKIGLTAVVAICLCYAIISFLKGINIFVPKNSYYVKFHDIQGLAVSNNVFANGYPIGSVREIHYDYSSRNNVIVEIKLDTDMRVPKGTKAELETSLMGGVTMNLLLGPNPANYINIGDTIVGGPHLGAVSQLQNSIPAVVAMLPKLDSILSNLNKITSNPSLNEAITNSAEAMKNFASLSKGMSSMMNNEIPHLMASLQSTSDNLNKISKDLTQVNVKESVNKINSTLGELEGFSKDLNQMSANLNQKLNSKDNSFGLLLNDRHLYDNLNHTASSADSLLIDLKAHPKRYVHFSIFGRKN